MGRVLMTGGGTGGHLSIISSVKEHMRDEELLYVGSINGQDMKWFGDDDSFIEKFFLNTGGVVNRRGLSKIKSLFDIATATIKAVYVIKKNDVRVVFSVGGFSSAPASFASILTRTPLIIHEQNAVSGSLNRLLKPYAKEFISSYDDNSPTKSYPVKSIFFEKARIRKEIKTILFLGGSQGALAINRLALDLAKELQNRGIAILHQAGEKHIDSVQKEYQKLGVEAEVFGFSKDIAEYMQRADFAIARAGASTLWELSANALPTLFIPYPYAAGDHQYGNAKFLVDRGMGWVVRESEIDTQKILEILSSDIESVSMKLSESISRDGAKEIANIIKSYQK